MFKKEKFPLTLFISASFLALIMFMLLLILMSLKLTSSSGPVGESGERGRPNEAKYYFREDFNNDPLITKMPSWENLLAGPIISSADPSIGNPVAKVNIVAFSDFICGHCADQEEIYQKMMNDYKNDIRFIWKDYPENDIESTSFQAALAARCAQEQDKFWSYHDLLYANNGELDEPKYYGLAKEINLDLDNFKDCFLNKKTIDLIVNNMKEADALEITGIPFIYVNNQEVMGKISYDKLKRIIDIQLEKNK